MASSGSTAAAWGTTFAVSLLLAGTPSQAHHSTFYRPLFKAIKSKNLEPSKGHFLKSVWNGEADGMSAAELQKLLEKSGDVKLLREYSRQDKALKPKARTLVICLLRPNHGTEPIWFFLLGEHPGDRESKGGLAKDKWRVVKITKDRKEAKLFFGGKFGDGHVRKLIWPENVE